MPYLSIVTPTVGTYAPEWLDALLKIQGDISFIFVFPPDVVLPTIDDPRVQIIVSKRKSEFWQRLLGVLAVKSPFIMSLDDDDFAHPHILNLVKPYFQRFPESKLLRPQTQNLLNDQQEQIFASWEPLPPMETMPLNQEGETAYLLRIPIVPLNNHFRWRHLFWPPTHRRDMHGAHSENFNNRIWRTEYVQPPLEQLKNQLAWRDEHGLIPQFTSDRSFSLYVQAFHYQPGIQLGHWLYGPAQIRRIHLPYIHRSTSRSYFTSDAFLARFYPQYGYFWNLFFAQLYQEPYKRLRHRWVKWRAYKSAR